MKKLREIGKLAGFCAGLGLMIFVAGAVFSPLQGVRDFIHNPFGFSTRITTSGPVVLMQMQKLAKLETGKYNGQTIVTGENKGVLPVMIAGDRLVFVAHGEVVAGVDLSQMKEGDVLVDGDKATVHLPKTEVFYSRLDNKTSQVYERQTGFFSQPDPNLETETRQQAEDQLRDAAIQNGLLDGAEKNAEDATRQQLGLMGIHEVTFA